MFSKRPFLVELVLAALLIAAPFALPLLDAAPNTVNRILVWGLFGIGFDILFGYTGLLSFGQSAFYGTGGFIAAYLLTRAGFPHVVTALFIGMVAAAFVGYLIGLLALRRTGIYFAMITVAIAEIFFFVEFNPLSQWTGGENGLPGVPTPSFDLGFTKLNFASGWSLYPFLALCYFVGIVIALRIVRSPVGAILMRDSRQSASGGRRSAIISTPTSSPLSSSPAIYAGFAGGLLGVHAGLHAAGRLHVRHVGPARSCRLRSAARGTLFGPLDRRRASGCYLQRLLPEHAAISARRGSSFSGIVFVSAGLPAEAAASCGRACRILSRA